MAKAIPENVSKKRGRPRFIDDDAMALIRLVHGPLTRRQFQNIVYAHQAINVIEGDQKCRYLWGGERNRRGTGGPKMTVLAELGRIRDDELLLETARLISENRLSTRCSIVGIRRIRGVCQESGTHNGLVHAICAAMNRYTSENPNLDGGWDTVFSALDTVRAIFEDTCHQRALQKCAAPPTPTPANDARQMRTTR